MHDLSEVCIARAKLAWLFEPDAPYLHDLLAAHAPADALEQLCYGNPPAAALRAEIRRVPDEDHWRDMPRALDDALRDGMRIVIPEDDDWPDGLADLAATPPHGGGQPPAALCLWVRGDLPVATTLHRSVTITGARAATAYGQHIATTLSHDLTGDGWTVATAGAFGVEAAAIRGTMTAEGTTVAVLPAGLDHPHPATHAALFNEIAQTGLLVSTWPPGTAPSRTRQAANVRLLAALTRGTVVVEAARRSGALHTLRQAIAMGRPAMVVPGPVTSSMSAGCHDALRQHPQARLVTGITDVLTELGKRGDGAPAHAELDTAGDMT
jgi:DNA processing protein